MSTLRTLFAATLIALTTGCASGLNPAQKSEFAELRAKNLDVEVKRPTWQPALAYCLAVDPCTVEPTVTASPTCSCGRPPSYGTHSAVTELPKP